MPCAPMTMAAVHAPPSHCGGVTCMHACSEAEAVPIIMRVQLRWGRTTCSARQHPSCSLASFSCKAAGATCALACACGAHGLDFGDSTNRLSLSCIAPLDAWQQGIHSVQPGTWAGGGLTERVHASSCCVHGASGSVPCPGHARMHGRQHRGYSAVLRLLHACMRMMHQSRCRRKLACS